MNHKPEKKPDSFDWVSARVECSLVKIFEKLKLQIKDDIASRNATRSPNMQYHFSIVDSNKDFFTLVVEGNQIHESIAFNLGEDKISVLGRNGTILEGGVTLCNDGECRVEINGQEYDLWQVRKMALEEFFFRPYSGAKI
jgi:hypothetical protein